MSEGGAGSVAAKARPRVLVTGANGLIGGFLMRAWRVPGSQFEPIGLARAAGPNVDIVADIRDLEAMTAAAEGTAAIVHMAASSAVGSSWEPVLQSNLIGTYAVFEAAPGRSAARCLRLLKPRHRHI